MATVELIELVALLAGAGVAAGVLAGLLGVGGGIVLVPVLDLAFGASGVPDEVRMHLAVGTSLASIVPTALSSARAHWNRGGIDPAVAASWSPAIAAGASLGAWLASRVGGGCGLWCSPSSRLVPRCGCSRVQIRRVMDVTAAPPGLAGGPCRWRSGRCPR